MKWIFLKTFTEDRGVPKSTGPVAITTFATIVDPALHIGVQIAAARDGVTDRKLSADCFKTFSGRQKTGLLGAHAISTLYVLEDGHLKDSEWNLKKVMMISLMRLF